ncbi:MAG: lysophospholipase [Chloroflexota bacterium]|nr:lysophospholipase [Chloroflexota bacterium]
MTDVHDARTSTTRDGLSLRTHRWGTNAAPRARVLLVHGIAEHATRHQHVARRLADAGIETHASDLRGFGASDGPRAFVDRWSRYHDDVEDQIADERLASPPTPVVLFGHSMGGLIALGYVLAEPPRPLPDLLVLSAPALAANLPSWKRTLAAVLGRLAPRFAVANDLPSGGLSRDPRVAAAYASDPLNTHRTTARLGMELLSEQARVQHRLAGLDGLPMPTYVLHGTADPIVPVAASALLEGKGRVTRRVYPDLRHEMHNEPEQETVIADTVGWLATALSELPRSQ